MTSPLLDLPGAVAGDGVDAPVAAHYGSFNVEQRALESGDGFVDLSHRDVVRIEGPDRLTWLHSLTTQHLESLAPGVTLPGLVLDPQGHVEHAFVGTDDGTAFTLHTEPGRAAALVEFLERMKFMMRAELTDVTSSQRRDLAAGAGRGLRALRARAARPAGVVRRGRRSRRRPVGVRGAADRAGRAPFRRRHRRAHDPQRGRLDRLGRAHGQGLLPRPGDRRPGAHPRAAAAAADAAAPRRQREPAAPGRRGPDARREVGRLRGLLGPTPRAGPDRARRW